MKNFSTTTVISPNPTPPEWTIQSPVNYVCTSKTRNSGTTNYRVISGTGVKPQKWGSCFEDWNKPNSNVYRCQLATKDSHHTERGRDIENNDVLTLSLSLCVSSRSFLSVSVSLNRLRRDRGRSTHLHGTRIVTLETSVVLGLLGVMSANKRGSYNGSR